MNPDETTPIEPAGETPAPAEASAPAPEPQAAPERSMDETIREEYARLTHPAPERARGPDGKFLRAETPEAPGDTGGEGPAPESPAPPPAAEPHPWDAAPNTWRKELAAEFGTLPETVRQEIHRREGDFHKGISQYRDAAAFGHAMFEDVSPHFDAMRQLGGTPREVVREVMGAWRALATGSADQKRATLLKLADGYGISLDELIEARNREPSAGPEIAPVLQRIERLESSITQSQQAAERAKQEALQAQVEKFISDPSRIYIETVFEDLLALVKSGLTPEEAYDKAIWSHPETRAQLLAKQDEERRKREAAEAAAARKAAAVNVAKRGTPPVKAPPGQMEDTIRETYRRLQT